MFNLRFFSIIILSFFWSAKNNFNFYIWVRFLFYHQSLSSCFFIWVHSVQVFVIVKLNNWCFDILRCIKFFIVVFYYFLFLVGIIFLWFCLNFRLFILKLAELIQIVLILFRKDKSFFITMNRLVLFLILFVHKSWINYFLYFLCFFFSLFFSKFIQLLYNFEFVF